MSANDFRIGQLVSAADSAKLAALCATYTHYSIHGIIVAVEGHRVDVKWIDYIGPQRQTYLLDPSLLRVGTLTTGTRPVVKVAVTGRHLVRRYQLLGVMPGSGR